MNMDGRIMGLLNRLGDLFLLNIIYLVSCIPVVTIGAATTALIQSSGVTTVLIVGFVNVGIMNLHQAAAMICNAALYRRRKKHFVFATPSLLTEFLNR